MPHQGKCSGDPEDRYFVSRISKLQSGRLEAESVSGLFWEHGSGADEFASGKGAGSVPRVSDVKICKGKGNMACFDLRSVCISYSELV